MKDFIARIKWKSVFLLVFTVIAVLLLFWGLLNLTPLAQEYKGAGDVLARSWMDPPSVSLKGRSTAWVEVRNTGPENRDVFVLLKTYDRSMVFKDSMRQEINESVELGPGESRKLGFELALNATYGGSYGVKVIVSLPGDSIEDEVFLEVSGK